jgi:alpha-L-fucosidase
MNGNFLLNIPPDRRGLFHENDNARLMELKKYLDGAFAINLASGASIEATNTRGRSFSAQNAIDGDIETYWATVNGIVEASLEIDFGKPAEVNAVLLQEYIRLGQRIKSFSIEAFINGTFSVTATGTTIGNRRIIRFDTVVTKKLKVNLKSKACPLISNIEVYCVPEVTGD